MDEQQEALKRRLLEIAKTESAKIGADINRTMKESIKLEKSDTEKWVKITFLKMQQIGLMFNKDNFDRFLNQFSEDGTPVEYELIEQNNTLLFKFQDEALVEKVYAYYHYFFFGDFQAEQINRMLNQYIEELMHDLSCASGACQCNLPGEDEFNSWWKSLEKDIKAITKKAQEKFNIKKESK